MIRHQIPIHQSRANQTTVLIAAAESKTMLLARLFLSAAVAGTVRVEDSDGLELTGAMPIAANTPLSIEPTREYDQMLATAADKGISIRTTQQCHGYAIVFEGLF